MYAQTLTSATVNSAPAIPESNVRACKNVGSILAKAGITYSAVRSAITPATNPNMAIIKNTFNLSDIHFHLQRRPIIRGAF